MGHLNTLRKLVGTPSVTGSEADIARYVHGRCSEFGHTSTLVGENVAVHVPGKDPSKGLVLGGHLDTIEPSTAQAPYVLTQNTNDLDLWHGLGASDMKSGLAVMLSIAQDLRGATPDYDVWFLFTSGEEEDNRGAKQLITNWFAPRHRERYQTIGGLILEPTVDADGDLFVGVGHRNGLILQVTAEGVGGHGSQQLPDGANAIDKLSRFNHEAMPEIRRYLNGPSFYDPLLGLNTANRTSEVGSRLHNVIGAIVTWIYDLRANRPLIERIDSEVERLNAEYGQEYGVTIEAPWETAPTVCPDDAHILKTIRRSLPHVPRRAFHAATDLHVFLESDMPMVMFGPGFVDQMHKPTENASASSMQRCADAISTIMRAF